MPIPAIADQFPLINAVYNLPVAINAPSGKRVHRAYAKGVWQGFSHIHAIATGGLTATVTIKGTPTANISGIWQVHALYDDGFTEFIMINYTVINKTPIYVPVSQIRFYRNTEVNLHLPVTNYNGGGVISGRLLGLKSGSDEDGVTILDQADTAVAAADNEMFKITLPHPMPSGDPIVYMQPFYVDTAAAPGMSVVSATGGLRQISYSWTAVAGATSYAFRLSTETRWVDVGNVTSYVLEDLGNGESVTTLWGVNSPWVSTTRSVTAMTFGVPGVVSPGVYQHLPPTSTTATIRWFSPNSGGSPILRYEYSLNNGSPVSVGLTVDLNLTNLMPNTRYSIRVRAVNLIGNGPWGGYIFTTAPVINAISNVTRQFGYSAFTIQASVSGNSGLAVTWSISGTGASISSSGLITIAAGRGVGTHNYTVTATTTAGSDTESFSLTVSSAAPVINAISNLTRTWTSGPIILQASASGATPITWSVSGFRSQISSTGLMTIPNFGSFASLGPGTHNYTVTATNAYGSDTESFSIIITTASIPPAAPSPTIEVSDPDTVIVRDAFPNSGGYPTIFRCQVSNQSDFSLILGTGVDNLPSQVGTGMAVVWDLTNQSPGTVLYFRARTENAYGNSAWVNVGSHTVT